MGTYAIMSGNTVSEVIVADNPQDASDVLGEQLIEYTESNPAGIGWIYDGKTFTPPVA